MFDFVYTTHPARVIFGSGKLSELGAEIARLGIVRALILSTPGQAASASALAARVGERAVGVFAGARMHTPVEVTEAALDVLRGLEADGLVSIGGGSTTGLSKALSLRTGLPQIAIPTTYAGSEMTPILGETENGLKTTKSSSALVPATVIYDVDLTIGLPPLLSATSGINAIAHAVEALYARERNPIIDMIACDGVRAMAGALPVIVRNPDDREARSSAQYGAWLCGICLGSVGMALHHKLCHALGGLYDLPHAETHTVVLPHVLAYNAPAVPDAMRLLAHTLENADPALALYNLAGASNAPRSLRELGMPESGIEHAVDQTMVNPYWNPRPLEQTAIRNLLARAWAGDSP